MLTFISDAFAGRARLWKVFWIVGICIKILEALTLARLLFVACKAPDLWPLLVPIMMVMILLEGLWIFSVIRCISNLNWKFFKYVTAVLMFFNIISWFFMPVGYINQFQEASGFCKLHSESQQSQNK